MSTNSRCFNLTKTVIAIELDNIKYEMLPMGTSNPDTGMTDNCIMRPEHVEDPKVQVLLLSTPPKLRIVPLKKVNNSEDMERVLNRALEEGNAKIKKYRENLDKYLTIETAATSKFFKTMLAKMNADVEEVRGKINEVYKEINKVKEQISNIEPPRVTKTTKASKRAGVQSIFKDK